MQERRDRLVWGRVISVDGGNHYVARSARFCPISIWNNVVPCINRRPTVYVLVSPQLMLLVLFLLLWMMMFHHDPWYKSTRKPKMTPSNGLLVASQADEPNSM
jgi:hypothetical protein